MKIVLISDTHTKHRCLQIPPADLLIHAGDITYDGDLNDLLDFNTWLGEQTQVKNKVIVFGNHDLTGDLDHRKYDPKAESLLSNCIYLNDSGCEIEGFKIWGSPMTPTFGWDWAFNRDRGSDIAAHWNLIPADTDILITHGPPYGVLDLPFGRPPSVGCLDLRDKIDQIKPRLHVFGHLHYCHGTMQLGDTLCVNASSLDEAYKPTHKPIVVELCKDGKIKI